MLGLPLLLRCHVQFAIHRVNIQTECKANTERRIYLCDEAHAHIKSWSLVRLRMLYKRIALLLTLVAQFSHKAYWSSGTILASGCITKTNMRVTWVRFPDKPTNFFMPLFCPTFFFHKYFIISIKLWHYKWTNKCRKCVFFVCRCCCWFSRSHFLLLSMQSPWGIVVKWFQRIWLSNGKLLLPLQMNSKMIHSQSPVFRFSE